jgi:hypothetical protein
MARKPKKDSDLSETDGAASPQRPGARARKKTSGTEKPASASTAKARPQDQVQLQRHEADTAVAEESGAHVTHEQIQDKAREIWHARGCPVGQDLEIWLEAEKALGR